MNRKIQFEVEDGSGIYFLDDKPSHRSTNGIIGPYAPAQFVGYLTGACRADSVELVYTEDLRSNKPADSPE